MIVAYLLVLSGSWTLEELSAKLGAPKELVHRKLALWQQQGVLREEAGGHFYVVEKGSSKEKLDRGAMLIDSDEERDSNTATQSEQREEKLQVRTSFIPLSQGYLLSYFKYLKPGT